jgi:hypothetical protein
LGSSRKKYVHNHLFHLLSMNGHQWLIPVAPIMIDEYDVHFNIRAKNSVSIRYLESPVCLTSVQRVPAPTNVGCATLRSLIGDVCYSLKCRLVKPVGH